MEYVYYEENNANYDEYIYAEDSSNDSPKEKTHSSLNVPTRPKHKPTIEGIYDELEFSQSSHIEASKLEVDSSKNNNLITNEKTKSSSISKRTAIIIFAALGTCIIGGVIIGIVVFLLDTNVQSQNATLITTIPIVLPTNNDSIIRQSMNSPIDLSSRPAPYQKMANGKFHTIFKLKYRNLA